MLSWKKVTKATKSGGLGIHRLADVNFSLLCKWLWNFQNENDALWRKIILAKYTTSFIGDISVESKHSSIRAPWRNITKAIE